VFKKIIFYLTLLVISGCSSKDPTTQNSAFIVLRTPSFTYADMGFIDKLQERTKIEIYAMGQPALKLDVNQVNVCLSAFECMSMEDFNAKFLSKYYPANTLEKIFRGLPLFNGASLYQSSNGFTQQLMQEGKYNIEYRVQQGETVFRDTINQIIIKVRYQ